MSNKYSLPYDIRMECIAYVRGYPRRVRIVRADPGRSVGVVGLCHVWYAAWLRQQ